LPVSFPVQIIYRIVSYMLVVLYHFWLHFNKHLVLSLPYIILLVSVAHWHSAHWAWNGYQPGLGSIPRPGRI